MHLVALGKYKSLHVSIHLAPSPAMISIFSCSSGERARQNWLFADQPIGAQTSAIIYSLVETAKLNGVNPYYYLRYVLEKMSSLPSLEELDESTLEDLMPWSVQLQDAIKAYDKEQE